MYILLAILEEQSYTPRNSMVRKSCHSSSARFFGEDRLVAVGHTVLPLTLSKRGTSRNAASAPSWCHAQYSGP